MNTIWNGLTQEQAKQNLETFGFNELPTSKPKSIFKIAVEVFKEPLFLLLIACSSLYLILGDTTEGVILFSSVFIIIFITFNQHRKTEKSLEALRQLSSPRALVIRDNQEVRITGREIVPNDIIILNEGDRVPADAILLESTNLTIDESLLTGEAIPVNKNENKPDTIYSGTLVVQGSGYAKVTNTGTNTEFGKIGLSLNKIEKESTRLQIEMKKLIFNLFTIGALISIGVIVAFYYTRGSILNALLTGLAASMALLPEEFPVVLTIFLALGAWRLSKNKVLTRKPSAIETLGAATVLCSDKTGTITQNKMQIVQVHYQSRIYNNQEFKEHVNTFFPLIEGLFWASAEHAIDPMEKAIHQEFHALNQTKKEYVLLKEYSLSKTLFAMTRVYEDKASNQNSAFCKGAPEAVFELCQLDASELAKQNEIVSQLASKGYRILACAFSSLHSDELPEDQRNINFSLLGLVAFEDPIRPEVPNAIKECNEAGIRVIMITGDYPETARSIANQIGILHQNKIITGSDLQSMDESVLKEKIKTTQVFARIIPEQKLQLINALKANREIVAMTGDGVNDAPALKAADIGIAMGLRGTDVAREASSLVLLDDNFISIVQAMRQGRKIFDNLQKAMSYIVAIHIPIIALVLMPAFFSSLPILLMPLHIVFLELIIDPVCAVAFESEQEEKNIMKRPPRKPNELFFGWKKIIFSIFKGLLLMGAVITVYFLSITEGHSEGEVRAISFSALIIGNVFLILTSLSETRSIFSILKEKNKAVFLISFFAFLVLILTITQPYLVTIFNFENPGVNHFGPSILSASIMLIVLELIKYLKIKQQ